MALASGDPLADRIILWTRVTPPPHRWRPSPCNGGSPRMSASTRVVARGTVSSQARSRFHGEGGRRRGCGPGATYHFDFIAAGEPSPVGRTRTLAAAAREPASGDGVVRGFRARTSSTPTAASPGAHDLDAVLFLGDYIYGSDRQRGAGVVPGRVPAPAHECVTLDDYAHATPATVSIRTWPRCTPSIRASPSGTTTRAPTTRGAMGRRHADGEGALGGRKAAARRAFGEWMPIRETPRGAMYRRFAFGGLADLPDARRPGIPGSPGSRPATTPR